jgi:hypothetical protein
MPVSPVDLQGIVALILRRAHQQGYIIPREVREELAAAGLSELLWKEVVSLASPPLRYCRGRYHYVPPSSATLRARVRQEQRQLQSIRRAVRRLIRLYKVLPVPQERRLHHRIELIRPIHVQTEDGRTIHLLTRDISLSGIRLLASGKLLGHKLRLWIPRPEDSRESFCFLVHILWSAVVGDGLYENGGIFLELLETK